MTGSPEKRRFSLNEMSGYNFFCLRLQSYPQMIRTPDRTMSSSVSIAPRSVSSTLSLPVQYRPTHVPGWPEEFTSEESDKSGTEKDTNRANSFIRHPRTWLLQCTGGMSYMRTGRLPSLTGVLASTNKQNVLTISEASINLVFLLIKPDKISTSFLLHNSRDINWIPCAKCSPSSNSKCID